MPLVTRALFSHHTRRKKMRWRRWTWTCVAAMDAGQMVGSDGHQKNIIVRWRAGTATKALVTRALLSHHMRRKKMRWRRWTWTCAAAMDAGQMVGSDGHQKNIIVQWRAGTATKALVTRALLSHHMRRK